MNLCRNYLITSLHVLFYSFIEVIQQNYCPFKRVKVKITNGSNVYQFSKILTSIINRSLLAINN